MEKDSDCNVSSPAATGTACLARVEAADDLRRAGARFFADAARFGEDFLAAGASAAGGLAATFAAFTAFDLPDFAAGFVAVFFADPDSPAERESRASAFATRLAASVNSSRARIAARLALRASFAAFLATFFAAFNLALACRARSDAASTSEAASSYRRSAAAA